MSAGLLAVASPSQSEDGIGRQRLLSRQKQRLGVVDGLPRLVEWWWSRRAYLGTRVRCVVAALLRRAGTRRRTGHAEPPRRRSALLTSLGGAPGGQGSRFRHTGPHHRQGRRRCRGLGWLSRLPFRGCATPSVTEVRRWLVPL